MRSHLSSKVYLQLSLDNMHLYHYHVIWLLLARILIAKESSLKEPVSDGDVLLERMHLVVTMYVNDSDFKPPHCPAFD